MRHRVAIVGGGFGGLSTARGLRSAPVEVTLLACRNHHLFQPLLYQAAPGMLSPANIAAPLRALVKHQANTIVGSSHCHFGHSQRESHAPGLKTVDDATEIRRRVVLAFDMAGRTQSPRHRLPGLTDARLISRRCHTGNATLNPGQHT